MTHMRGFPDFERNTWHPLCSTREAPISGDVTTAVHEVTCNECRRVMRLRALPEFEDDSSRRYP